MDLLDKLKAFPDGNVIVQINPKIKDVLRLLIFERDSLSQSLLAAVDNRYGFYDSEDIRLLLEKMDSKERQRQDLINAVGVSLLGQNYQQELDELGLAFSIDMDTPSVTFFKVQ